jgi:transcriptional regulator with XRE-family HTH domain
MSLSRLPDPIDVAVGARVRDRRKALRISQTALAESLGMTFQQVQKYERGANRVSASILVKIAAKLDTTVAALVGENEHGARDRAGEMIHVDGAAELLAGYAAISTPRVRQAVLSLVLSFNV